MIVSDDFLVSPMRRWDLKKKLTLVETFCWTTVQLIPQVCLSPGLFSTVTDRFATIRTRSVRARERKMCLQVSGNGFRKSVTYPKENYARAKGYFTEKIFRASRMLKLRLLQAVTDRG